MVLSLIGLAALVYGITSAAPPSLLSLLLLFLLVFQIWSGVLAWPIVCTAIAVPGIAIVVHDSVTYFPAAAGALGLAKDGR